jgi:hypothetical protein
MADYPQYQMAATLDNGMQFSVVFGPAPGLPPALEDALAAAAARAIRDFDWASTGITPTPTSAAVVITRQDIAGTDIPLS